MSYIPPHERYRHDAQFRMLVDSVYAMMDKAQFTPTELREAVILAATMYHERNIQPLIHYEEGRDNL